MEALEITQIIETEIEGNWSLTNAHGVDLRQCLVTPAKQTYEDSFKEGETVSLWLVLEEVPEDQSGYKIVFDEESRQFGLAIRRPGRADVFLGFYGTFLETFKGM